MIYHTQKQDLCGWFVILKRLAWVICHTQNKIGLPGWFNDKTSRQIFFEYDKTPRQVYLIVYDKSPRQVFLCMTNHPDKFFCVWPITQASLVFVYDKSPRQVFFVYDKSFRQVFLCMTKHPRQVLFWCMINYPWVFFVYDKSPKKDLPGWFVIHKKDLPGWFVIHKKDLFGWFVIHKKELAWGVLSCTKKNLLL
jgi:hypothetical protein